MQAQSTMEPAKEKNRRGRPREFDKAEALRKALTVFWKQGYEHTTMNDLTDVMEISSPSIYCAFGNKSDLFLEALAYYKKTFWQPVFDAFMSEPDIYKATRELFDLAPRILLSPQAPCGCLVVFSALTLPQCEDKILPVINKMRNDTKNVFRERLIQGINAAQLPSDCDVPAISGALTNFFEGLSLQARSSLCLSELLAIAAQGIHLLPAPAQSG